MPTVLLLHLLSVIASILSLEVRFLNLDCDDAHYWLDGVFESSCGVLAAASPEHLKETFHVRFEGEEGMVRCTCLISRLTSPDRAMV